MSNHLFTIWEMTWLAAGFNLEDKNSCVPANLEAIYFLLSLQKRLLYSSQPIRKLWEVFVLLCALILCTKNVEQNWIIIVFFLRGVCTIWMIFYCARLVVFYEIKKSCIEYFYLFSYYDFFTFTPHPRTPLPPLQCHSR